MKSETGKSRRVPLTPALKARIQELDAAHKKLAAEFESLEDDPEAIFIGLQLEAIHQIRTAMEKDGVTRAELARRMGCSRQNITQLLSDEANFKLEMLARIAAALKKDVTIRLIDKDEEVTVRAARATRSHASPREKAAASSYGHSAGKKTSHAPARPIK